MERIVFKNGIVEDYTIVLCTRDQRKLGQLTGLKGVQFKNNLNSPAEMSFTVSKHDLLLFNGITDSNLYRYKKIKNEIWKRIVDLKLIWVKELDKYFEIKVRTTDSKNGITKAITATHLCEAELAQLLLENIEINTEADILRPDYKVTEFYNDEDPEASLLHRILKDKAPHYKIKHVDVSLRKMVRSFSISSTTIYDFLVGECAEQINCLFVFDSKDRSISVFDLMAVCQNPDCGNRQEDYDKCTNVDCGSTNLKYFGKDTTILVDKDNLSEEIQCEVNADNIKNCFKMVAGDDLMTDTIRLLNQNGSDYIYYFSEMQREDMPEEMKGKIDKYNDDYNKYSAEYQDWVKQYYDLIDHQYYLEHGMMPDVEIGGINATTEAAKITHDAISPIGLLNVTDEGTHTDTVNSAIKNYIKVIVKSGYVKIDIQDDSTFEYVGVDENECDYGYWSGTVIITNYSDEKDVVTVPLQNIVVHDNYIDYINQKLLKQMNQDDSEGSIYDVLSISYPDDRDREIQEFTEALKYYCKNRLVSFYDAIEGALITLSQLGHDKAKYDDPATKSTAYLYPVLYVPYEAKKIACANALNTLQTDKNFTYIKDGEEFTQCLNDVNTQLETVSKELERIQNELNFEKALGDLYPAFCSYRREDIYSNDNFISEGLTNEELINRALEFIETAKKELYKSGEKQVNISSTLYNLLLMDEFKPLQDNFELGNWIRVKVDGEIYRLRLLSYTINFDNLQTISVEFSTASKIKDLVYEAQQIHKTITSVSSNYSYVSKQAEQGGQAQDSIQEWMDNGLSSALIQIKNNDNAEVIYDKHGLICRAWDDIANDYDPKQLRILRNAILFTKDNWGAVEQAIGEHTYKKYNQTTNQWDEIMDYGLTAKFVNAAHISGSDLVGNILYSTNFELNNPTGDWNSDKYDCTGSFIDMKNNCFSFGNKLSFNGSEIHIDKTNLKVAIDNISETPNNLSIYATNIDTSKGKIISDQIKDITVSQIQGTSDGKIQAHQINNILSTQINGEIDAAKISGKVAFAAQADSSTTASSVPASGIDGTISTDKITNILTDKSITGSFSGDVDASSVKVTDGNGITYTGVTGDFTITGNAIFKIVNGIIVSVSQ